MIRKRVCAGAKNARLKGKHLGRPERSFIDRAGELRRQGRNLPQIARKLGAGWEPYPNCEFYPALVDVQ